MVYAIVQGAVYGAISNAIINMGIAALTGQNLNMVLKAGLNGAVEGAITGAVSGGIGFGLGTISKIGPAWAKAVNGIGTALKTVQYTNIGLNAIHGAQTGDWTGFAKAAAHYCLMKWTNNPITKLSDSIGRKSAGLIDSRWSFKHHAWGSSEWVDKNGNTHKREWEVHANTEKDLNFMVAKERMVDFLGEDARVITNSAGDKVFLSADGTKRIQFHFNDYSPHENPHIHVDKLLDNGRWDKIRIFIK